MKKIILIFMLFFAVSVYADVCDYPVDYPYTSGKIFYYSFKDCLFMADEPVTAILGYNLGKISLNEDLYNSCGSNDILDRRTYGFGSDSSSSRLKLPFKLLNCFVKCDKDKEIYNHWWDFDTDQDFDYLDSTVWYFEHNADCTYDSTYANQDVTQQIGCSVIANPFYEETANQYYQGVLPTLSGHCQLNLLHDYCWTWTPSGQTVCTDIWDINIHIVPPNTTTEVPGSSEPGTGGTGGGAGEPSDPGEAGEGSGGGGGAGGGSDGSGSEQDEQGVANQKILQQELKIDKQRTVFLQYLIWIMEIVFGFILLIFYIFELITVIFVFGSWIPGIFRSMVAVFKKLGGDV